MHPSTTATQPCQPSPPPLPPPEKALQTLLDLITSVLSILLASSLTVRSFVGRWQVLHTKLTSLQYSLSLLSDSPHWSQNPLLHTLLPSILSTLQRLHSLCNQCSLSSFNGGKLLFQSDLDIASSSLSNHLHDLDLLLKSGVLYQSNAIVLSHPGPSSSKEELAFFVRDLFTRLQIGGVEFKRKALDSLVQILDEKSATLVAKEGNIGYLITLLDSNANHRLIQEQAVLAVSLLASSSDDARKIVFEQGGLGPLLRIFDSGSTTLKEQAAIAVEAITSDPDNGWAILAYGGVSVLIEACRSGSEATCTHAVGAIRNVAAVEDIKMAIAEEGAVPVLVNLLVSTSSTHATREKAAHCVAILASSGEYFRALIIKERGVQRLMDLIQNLSSSDTLTEHVLRAISSLSLSDPVARILSSSTLFITRLGDFIRHGTLILQQMSVSLLASLTISDGNKRAIEGCAASLIKLMETPKPAEAATVALVSLLTVKSNKKELVRDEKCLMKLVQMLDPKNEFVAKKFPVMVVAALVNGGSAECRKRLMAAGVYQHLQSLAEMDVAGAKKALQRLAGNKLKNIFSRTWRE